ncbi:MAG: phosphoribosylanthranilate isomerase [Pseudomonadota bacterium]
MIKICGLRTRGGRVAARAAGANAIGFVFAESVRRVTPAAARDAAAGAPADILRVAVMRHPGQAEWQAVADGFAPDVLQTDVADFTALDVPGTLRRWPVYREGQKIDPAHLPDEFLYEGRSSGSGETVDWDRAQSLAARGRMILAGGLSSANVGTAIERARPWGVDVSSAVERKPGEKDPQMIRSFIAAARAAEQRL